MKEEEKTAASDSGKTAARPVKKHLIKITWLRRLLKTLMWVVIAVLLLPVLLYIPPIQNFAISIAKNQIKKSTGMEIGIGSFRLSFPLDVHLKDVYVLTAQNDTMIRAGEAIADVKLLPLLKLDVKLNRLDLDKGYFKMVLPDSSMTLTVNAGHLSADDKSSFNLADNKLLLNKVKLDDGSLGLYMDVWKKKPTPEDTTESKPFYIAANDIELNNFRFGMSMLPTIDTLDCMARKVKLKEGVVDLASNLVKWKMVNLDGGDFRYIQPTPEYVAAHPAPLSEPSTGPPMQIKGDSVGVRGMKALYATKGVVPAAGFDAGYISVDSVAIGMKDFYNESSTVRLPITLLRARERSGLEVVSGQGLVAIDSIGLSLKDLNIRTLYSQLKATADVPFAMMSLDPKSPMSVRASGRIGLPDVESFMPSLSEFTAKIPSRKPLDFDLNAAGSLASLKIDKLLAEMAGVVRIEADGNVANVLDYKRLKANISLEGDLMDPELADQFLAPTDMRIPAFKLQGIVNADGLEYGADIDLLTTAGDLAANGYVGIDTENYNVDLSLHKFDVARYAPTIGVGEITGTVSATGHGFNPMKKRAVTDARVLLKEIVYNKRRLHDISVNANIDLQGVLSLKANSPNPGLDLDLEATGTIHPDDYKVDLLAHIRDLNLQELGLTDSINSGKGTIYLNGTASPERWLYDAEIQLVDLDWNLPSHYIHLPGGLNAKIKATELLTMLDVDSHLTNLHFESPEGLKKVVDSFIAAGDTVMAQIGRRNLVADNINNALPHFDLSLRASGNGLLDQLLLPTGIRVDTVWANINRDSLLRGDVNVRRINSGSMKIDTIGLNFSQRSQLIDYLFHMGNRPGTLDQFAQVDVRGYLGHNRISAFLNQHDIKGNTGYRLGLTAALMDSIVTVHLTPLKATIAYMPWTINNDNFIDYNVRNHDIDANLLAKSAESSILARTEPNEYGGKDLHLNIDNLKIQDFLSLSVFAPPITASVSTDLRVNYEDHVIQGGGRVSLKDFTYDKIAVGDFDLDVNAGYGFGGANNTNLNASLRINNEPAMNAYASLRSDSTGSMATDSVGLRLTRFPLKVANAFLGNNVLLSGYLNGQMAMSGSFSKPVLNGAITFDTVAVKIPMLGATLKPDETPLKVTDNVVTLDNFQIFAANKNPLTINGSVDARKFTDIRFDIKAHASNLQLINSDKRSKSDLYGKINLNLDATAKGPLRLLDVTGNVNILGTTDATYRLNMMGDATQGGMNADEVVKFVNFNDTTQVAQNDSIVESPLNMRTDANLRISPGTQLQVLLSTSGTDKVQLQPTANLRYFQNYMGDMSVTGSLTLGQGMVRYAFPVIGEKTFEFDPSSMITWTGSLMNPTLNVTATDIMKANVTQGGNSRLVNFLVTLHASNTIENLKVNFDLATNDDLSIQNELQSMSADQRQTQAMNLLLYGKYSGQGIKANASLDGNVLYSFLESQLNSWVAQHVRGVDLSFGINQYDKSVNGSTSTQTSYSYQVSKSLFNNRFKILVGGNYSTDDSAEENLAQNLFSDVRFEYILKQTQTLNMSVQLFRHYGYESILEGEITEMGLGFVMKRKLSDLRGLFYFGRHRRNRDEQKDSLNVAKPDSIEVQPADTVK